MKYTIDYESGTARLYTPSDDWETRFYELAHQCFGIRKSIGNVKLISSSKEEPSWKIDNEYERLQYSGDLIIWNKDGIKIKSEWD